MGHQSKDIRRQYKQSTSGSHDLSSQFNSPPPYWKHVEDLSNLPFCCSYRRLYRGRDPRSAHNRVSGLERDVRMDLENTETTQGANLGLLAAELHKNSPVKRKAQVPG